MSAVTPDYNLETPSITGISGQFAGADTRGQLKQFLKCASDGVGESVHVRWNLSTVPNLSDETLSRIRHGGLVRIDLFGSFHGVSPSEAAEMHPEQRLLLEHSSATTQQVNVHGSSTGVFVGTYSFCLDSFRPLRLTTDHSNATCCVTAARLAYHYDLTGPAVAYDTACASFLVAAHGALSSVRLRECTAGLIATVNLMLVPAVAFHLAIANMTSLAGRCFAFDIRADGFARAEACTVCLLSNVKRNVGVLHIAACVIGHNGKCYSITTPNGFAQMALFRAAIVQAGIGGKSVVCLAASAHGSAMGDIVESNSVSTGLTARHVDSFIMSTVTGSFGFSESASGAASLVQMALEVQGLQGLPNAQLRIVHSLILKSKVLTLPTHPVPLNFLATQETCLAMNSFGFRGTNAHAIVRPSSACQMLNVVCVGHFKRRPFLLLPVEPCSANHCEWRETDHDEQRLVKVRDLQRIIEKVSGMHVEADTMLLNIGLDSISISALQDRLQRNFSLAQAPILDFRYTITKLTDLIIESSRKQTHDIGPQLPDGMNGMRLAFTGLVITFHYYIILYDSMYDYYFSKRETAYFVVDFFFVTTGFMHMLSNASGFQSLRIFIVSTFPLLCLTAIVCFAVSIWRCGTLYLFQIFVLIQDCLGLNGFTTLLTFRLPPPSAYNIVGWTFSAIGLFYVCVDRVNGVEGKRTKVQRQDVRSRFYFVPLRATVISCVLTWSFLLIYPLDIGLKMSPASRQVILTHLRTWSPFSLPRFFVGVALGRAVKEATLTLREVKMFSCLTDALTLLVSITFYIGDPYLLAVNAAHDAIGPILLYGLLSVPSYSRLLLGLQVVQYFGTYIFSLLLMHAPVYFVLRQLVCPSILADCRYTSPLVMCQFNRPGASLVLVVLISTLVEKLRRWVSPVARKFFSL